MTYGTPLFLLAEIIPIFHWLGFVIPSPRNKKQTRGSLITPLGRTRCVCVPPDSSCRMEGHHTRYLVENGRERSQHALLPQNTYITYTQGTNLCNLAKRKIIFKCAFLRGYVSSQGVYMYTLITNIAGDFFSSNVQTFRKSKVITFFL